MNKITLLIGGHREDVIDSGMRHGLFNNVLVEVTPAYCSGAYESVMFRPNRVDLLFSKGAYVSRDAFLINADVIMFPRADNWDIGLIAEIDSLADNDRIGCRHIIIGCTWDYEYLAEMLQMIDFVEARENAKIDGGNG